MSNAPQPLLLEGEGRRLFAVYHEPSQPAKNGVLICPPLLHEHARSYRLFALLGDALASLGIAVLRFDYAGTGDSAGDDASFSLAGANIDAATALRALRERIGDVPIDIAGVRAGAFPAVSIASADRVRALWLWQPVLDGAAYLAELRELDRGQRESHNRYPQRDTHPSRREDGTLMGFACNSRLFEELQEARIPSSVLIGARVIVLDSATRDPALQPARRLELACVHADWTVQVDIGQFLRAPVRELAARLATSSTLP